MRKSKTPFRFENTWLRMEEFKELVKNWCVGYNVRGSYSHNLEFKLKALKWDLKLWSRGFWEFHYQ